MGFGEPVCFENQWHDEQSDDPQEAQPDLEPVDEDLNLYPAEKPKEDIFFVGSLSPQAGQTGSSSLKTSISNSFPHCSHTYSYIGIFDILPISALTVLFPAIFHS